MKQNLLSLGKALVLCAVTGILMTSCKKEKNTGPEMAESREFAATLSSIDISRAISADGVLRTYNVRGSRTTYRGMANSQGSNIILSLDYAGVKTIEAAANNKALVCDYGQPSFGTDLGWQYVIGYDKKKKQITLAPNDAMAADIVPGSFETRYVSYDAAYKTFNFLTRYVDKKTGNENEVMDILTEQ